MAIYKVLYSMEAPVTSGGRLTIPKQVRDDCKLKDGDRVYIRVEQTSRGDHNIVLWRAPQEQQAPPDQVESADQPESQAEEAGASAD